MVEAGEAAEQETEGKIKVKIVLKIFLYSHLYFTDVMANIEAIALGPLNTPVAAVEAEVDVSLTAVLADAEAPAVPQEGK